MSYLNDLSNVSITLVGSLEEAQAMIEWCRQPHPRVALDTETTEVAGGRARLRLFQLGDTETAWVIPYERGGWGGLVREALNALRGTTFLMHNFAFDQNVLFKDGLELPDHRVCDTRIMAHLVDPTENTGLKDLCNRLIDPTASAGEKRLKDAMKKGGWDWSTVPVELTEYWLYAGFDTILTARVDAMLYDEVFPRFERAYDLEYACQGVLKGVQRRGVRIDLERVHETIAFLQEDIDALRVDARERFDVQNLTSDAQVAKRALELGWDPKEWTPSGRPSMAKGVIHPYTFDDAPYAELLRQCLMAKHLVTMAGSQYLGGYEALLDADHMIHPSINPLGTRTARMTVKEPALQTLHRDATVRNVFIPREKHKLVFADYDQMEARLTAHFSGDPNYIATIRGSSDVHRDTAAQIYGISPESVSSKMRAITKNAVYAIIYGAGVDKFALTAGIGVNEAKDFLAQYHRAFPGVRVLQDTIQQRGLARMRDEGLAYVTSPLGRRHPLARWEAKKDVWEDPRDGKLYGDGDYYKLLNYLVQGTGADELKRSVVELDRAGVSDYLVLLVHDELGLDVPEGEVEEVKKVLIDCMENHELLCPLTVSATVVDRWGDKYETAESREARQPRGRDQVGGGLLFEVELEEENEENENENEGDG